MPSIEDAINQALAKLDSTESDQPAAEVQEPVDAGAETNEPDTDEVEDDEDEDLDEDLDEEGGEEGDSAVVELDEDQIVRIGGREGSVKDLLEMKADYTRKTQELADERKKVEAREQEVEQVYNQLSEWYTSRANDPSGWVAEIVSAASDPTAVFAVALRDLADKGMFDPEFVKVFGLTAPDNPVNRKASEKAADKRVAELERKLTEREERESAEQQQVALVTEYERQLENIIAEESIKFSSAKEEQEFRIELLTFAKENDLYDNLEVAYAVMARSRAKVERERNAQKAQTVTKKRKAQVISRPSSTTAPDAPEKVKGGDYEAAARLALARLQQPAS